MRLKRIFSIVLTSLIILVFSVGALNGAHRALIKNKNGVYDYKKIDVDKDFDQPLAVKEIKFYGPLEKNREVLRTILSASKKYRIEPELVMAVIKAESNFKSDAVSPAGAEGIMQIMPSTGIQYGVLNPFNYKENIFGGTRYLRYLLNLFMGNIQLAVAAYNAGENAVYKYGTIPPYKETQLYVKKVVSYYHAYLYKKFKKLAYGKKILKKARKSGKIRITKRKLRKLKKYNAKKSKKKKKWRKKTI